MSEPTSNSPPAAPSELLPPGEEFWESYSPHYEFPLSTVTSVALHAVGFGLLALILYYAWQASHNEEKTPPPVRGVMLIDGSETDGGNGTGDGPLERKGAEDGPDRPVPEAMMPLDAVLKERIVTIKEWVPELKDNPNADILAASAAMEKLRKLDPKIRGGLLKDLTAKGSPTGGADKGGGGEPSGKATSSGRRALRWNLLFSTRNGNDYLNQLAAMKATVAFGLAADGKKLTTIPDLNNPDQRTASDQESLPKLYFIDDSPDSVARLSGALKLAIAPAEFIAFFPKEIEEELAAKERGYRHLTEDQIFSTTFRILIVDGKPEIRVIEQQRNPTKR